ncbi:MAG TPA: hypothetical protein VNS32_02635 [Flavisolibacter sp.]|nr:hypothetical protein [Flavisolibacter sp.]
MLKKAFDFFVFTSLFIAFGAVLMVWQTAYLFGIPLSTNLAAFVFFGTVCSYNFHWYLTPPSVSTTSVKTKWNINYKYLHLILFIIGLIGSAVFTLLLIQHWVWLILTAFLTFLYSAPKLSFEPFIRLRKFAIGKTIFLAVDWAHITSVLPVLVSTDSITTTQIWFAINRFLFIYGICIIFDRRDVVEDRKEGIKSFITILSEKGIDRLFWGTMIAHLLSFGLLVPYFSTTQMIILFFPAIILSLLYYPSKTNSSDYLYYFVLDGLVMLSATILVLIKFVR